LQVIVISKTILMAKVTLEVVEVLRKTAENIEKSNECQWGHMGSCNCGFLAQQVTHLNKTQIHSAAMQGYGDWTEQLNDYCPTSGLKLDDLISTLINFGFDADDLKHLERLSDPKILQSFPYKERTLSYNVKADVVNYITRWADLVESTLLNDISISSLRDPVAEHTDSNL
jgi:hypothetical protein